MLLLLKIFVSGILVIAITGIAEHFSSRFAGVLLGFPLGVGLSLFFIGIEQGPVFAANSALWSIQGLVASLMFCIGYRAVLYISPWNKGVAVLPPILVGLFLFFGFSWLLQKISLDTVFSRFTVVAFSMAAASLFFRMGDIRESNKRTEVTWLMIGARALSAAIVVVCITGVAGMVGPSWSGLFSAFPATILPVVVILHFHYGSVAVPPLFKELPQGMVAIIVFSLAVYATFPYVGVFAGTFFSYVIAGCYLFFYELSIRKRINTHLDKIIASFFRHN